MAEISQSHILISDYELNVDYLNVILVLLSLHKAVHHISLINV